MKFRYLVTMNHFLHCLGTFLIFFIGFSSCIINDTELSDFWDDCEDEISNECAIFENQSMINEPANAMQTVESGETHFVTTGPLLIDTSYQLEELLSQLQYEVSQGTPIETTIPQQPQPSIQMESTSEIHNDTEVTERKQKKVRKPGRRCFRRFVTIGIGSRKAWGNTSIFKNLSPGISNARKISQEEEVDIILHSLGYEHQWEELREYPIQNYYGYWANVCDYFWMKTTPNDELYRGCFVGTQIFPDSSDHIRHVKGGVYFKSTNVELLKCQCYFYMHHHRKPNSTIFKIAVHKYRDNDYFVLKKIPRTKNGFEITDLLTQVYLPHPQNNSVMRESNQLEELRTEPQTDTEMVDESANQPHRNLPRRKFLSIGRRSRIGQRESILFLNAIPGKSNPHNLSQEQLELEFVSHKDKPRWKEMKQYSLEKYIGYWGNVCDYFWKKPRPDDKRYRGCWVRTSFYPFTFVSVVLSHVTNSIDSRKLDVLQCQCHYYKVNYRKPDSNQTDFAINKHRENEYFILDRIPNSKFHYRISDLLTDVYLLDPTN